MAYSTITYRQCDASSLQSTFMKLQTFYNEIPSKKCLNMVPGLMSCSFKIRPHVKYDMIQSLFMNKPVWIKHGLKSLEEAESQLFFEQKYSELMGISFGYLITNINYSSSKQIQNNHSLKWQLNVNRKYMAISYKIDKQFIELRLTQECLDNYFLIMSNINGIYIIILPLKASPRCYKRSQDRNQLYQRILTFGYIDAVCLSNSSALCLQFNNKESLDSCIRFLIYVMKLDCHHSPISCMPMAPQVIQTDHPLFDFWSRYAYQALLTLGYRINNQITQNTLWKIASLSYSSKDKQYPEHPCYLKLMTIYHKARRNRFFDINQEFDNIQSIPSSLVMDKWAYVPRVYLTPYGIFPLPVKPMRGNRVLRERERFGPAENFCRVIIRDVDLGQPQPDFMQIHEEWIKNLIIGQIYIALGNQQFYFLLCSNSQLRDRSFWFHAPYNGCRAEDIRRWMGDFSSESCVGRRIARMALALTGTTATISLLPHQIERISDIVDEHYRIFTDGVGKISPKALKQALKAYSQDFIEDDYIPSVIQGRLNGIKGIFVIAPDLDNRGILIQYRPSQWKFQVDHNVLEIIKYSSSGMVFLNRQVIDLLENMGVPEHIFLKLQNKTRLKISMSLLANKSAQHILKQHVRSYDWERMQQSGIQLTQEPFARSLLLLLTQERLKRLKERSHVQIPLSDGRMLLGVVDETNSLKYGQVFIQLRDLNGERQVLQNRKILITKNPAHFPGDMRILDAIDCPDLHYLDECVVFPAQGERPHPNEISGSDLDGDEYWVCWNEDLVKNATQQFKPAKFDSVEKMKHNGEITMITIADFLYKYLSSDSLGALSNRHLACCASYGPNHEYSLRLAEVISQAVDFPKTGVLPGNPTDIKIDQYPDFMENTHKKSFEPKSSVGTMYRQVKTVWTIHSEWQDALEEQSININKDFLIGNYEDYVNEAEKIYQYYALRINTILLIYNLPNEYELITGCHSCAEEEKKNNDSVETASLEFRHLQKEMRNIFETETLSYKKQLSKASAWYYVAYKAGTILSFGWIMNRLMSDIMKCKRLPQEEHQALKRIGKAIVNGGFQSNIEELASLCNVRNTEYENFPITERLGGQFLKIIDQYNNSFNGQQCTDQFLIFLHKVALNIL